MIPSLEGWPIKAKEAPSHHKVRLALLYTNPVFRFDKHYLKLWRFVLNMFVFIIPLPEYQKHFTLALNEQKMIFLSEGLYSQRDAVCKLKYSQKLSRRNRSLEILMKELLLFRPRSTVIA